jgi:curved DNA-binding protein CbpA
MTDSYYTILGVPKNATSKQIRERFLQLARDRHPDRYAAEEKADAEIAFQQITQAYNILHDAKRRRQYDEEQDVQARSPTSDVTAQAARVYLRRGIEALKKKRYQEAATNLEQATQEDGKDPQAWYYLAEVYAQRTSLLSRALAAAAKACELDPANPDYLKQAGKLAATAGMTTRAAKYYRDALTFGGEDSEVRAALKALKK